MKLVNREQIEDKFECWDLTTKQHHNFIANGAVVHNCNARFLYTEEEKDEFDSQGHHILSEGRMWAGSRTNWKAKDDKSLWWQALNQNPWIQEWCMEHPGLVLYGEVFGQVQNLKYGSKPGQVFFRVFDILDKDRWMGGDEVPTWDVNNNPEGGLLHFVPTVYCGPFDEAKLRQLAEENSLIEGADHIREGVVIKPVVERNDPEVGRVQLKIVSPKYLAGK